MMGDYLDGSRVRSVFKSRSADLRARGSRSIHIEMAAGDGVIRRSPRSATTWWTGVGEEQSKTRGGGKNITQGLKNCRRYANQSKKIV